MRKLKQWLCLLLACAMCLSFAGCAGEGGEESGSTDLAGTTVKFLMWTTPSKFDEQLFENFRQETGINLEVTVTTWGDCWDKLVNGVASGDPYDVTMLFSAFYPQHVTKNLFMPIDSFWDKEDPLWFAEHMEYYNWKGKHYAFCSYDAATTTLQTVMPLYMYYNKDMIENAGLEDPVQLQEEGRWNWDVFKEMLEELTIDSNNDGTIDQWGLSNEGYVYTGYTQANDTGFTKQDAQGNWVLNFDDPALTEALEYIVDIHEKYAGTGDLTKGTAAFRIQGEDGGRGMYNLDLNWDFVDVPYGPNNTEKKSVGGAFSGLGIINGSKNADGAYEFIRYVLDNKNAVESDEFTEAQRQRIKDSKKRCTTISPTFEYHDIYAILPSILNRSKTVTAALKSVEEQWKNGILKTLAGTGIVTLADGKAFQGMDKIDFEKGTMDPMRIVDEENVTATITTNPEEIVSDQYSLVLGTKQEMQSTSFIEIDPDKISKIEPGNIYNISISYRILEDFGNNGYGWLEFGFVDADGNVYGERGEISGSKGDMDTATSEVQFIDNVEGVRLRISGEYVGKVAIDDIIITSHK